MLVGVPSEIKNNEARVGLTPSSVQELVHHRHRVMVQAGAGLGAGLTDEAYVAAGAEIVEGPERIFAEAEMVVKVKEPQAEERKRLRPGQVLFTYLHLAPDPEQTRDLMETKAVCIAYETVTSPTGALPLLTPCPRLPAGLHRRSEPTLWKRRRADPASCSAASRAFRQPPSSSWVEACQAPMRPRSPSAWAPG
jgi:alanine dehydrogenase